MDQSKAPLLDALSDYHQKDRYGFSPPGHRQPRAREEAKLQAPQHGSGGRPWTSSGGGEAAERPAVRVPGEVRHPRVLFARTLVSMGLSTQSDAEFSTSEGIPLPKTD
jgi:hypothetical protein